MISPADDSKRDKYQALLKSLPQLVRREEPWFTGYANVCALLREAFSWHWVGFYMADDQRDKLFLGPYQGPLACTFIPFSQGVCGRAYRTAQTQIVPDVHAVPDHIACSSQTNSEIVVPIFDERERVSAVLDIDSVHYNSFDQLDQEYLEKIALYLGTIDIS